VKFKPGSCVNDFVGSHTKTQSNGTALTECRPAAGWKKMLLWCALLFLLLSRVQILFSQRQEDGCKVGFKVYVYDIAPELLVKAEEARKNRSFHVCVKCIYEQFALEYIIYDYFTQFCGRTFNTEEADFFYLPIIRDVDYRIALSQNGNRASSPIETALLEAIEKQNTTTWKSVFNVTDKYWNRYQGADHIIVMPAPVTNLRHQSNMRGFFHYVR
jgi:hypothetical protein